MSAEAPAAKSSGSRPSTEGVLTEGGYAKLQTAGRKRLFHPAGTPFPKRENSRSRTFHFPDFPKADSIDEPVEPKRARFSDYTDTELATGIYAEINGNPEAIQANKHPLTDRLHKPLVTLGKAFAAAGSLFGIQHTPVFADYQMSPGMTEVYNSYGGAGTWGQIISGEWIDDVGRRNIATEKGTFQIPSAYQGGKTGLTVSFGNIYDQLSKAGKDGWLDTVRQTPPPADWSSDAGKSWPDVIQNRLAILPSEMRQYVEGTPDWINRYGLPVSIKDYGPWISVRFQRSNLQLLKENLPYGKKGQVLVANGGSVAKEAGGIIPDSASSISSNVAPSIPEINSKYSPWPSEIADAMKRLVLPADVHLVRSASLCPPKACYVEKDREIWLAPQPDAPSDLGLLAYELGHAHKQRIRELEGKLTCDRSDPQRCWEETSEGQAFMNTFNTVNTRLRQQGQPELTLQDTGYYIGLFNVLFTSYILGDPSFKNAPPNWERSMVNTYKYPEWVNFFNTWVKAK